MSFTGHEGEEMRKKPNILFLFSDQHRGDWLPYDQDILDSQGNSGLELRMPSIRRMMDQGTCFTNAWTPAAICAPARACLASGRRYRNCRVATNKVNYDPALPSFYRTLSENGYEVCGVGKFDLNKADFEWEDGFHRTLREMGFTQALDSEGKMDVVWASLCGTPGPYGRMLRKNGLLDAYVQDMSTRGNSTRICPVPDELYADNWIGSRSLGMLSSLPSDRPWFLQVNFSGPHDPWDITESMRKSVEGRAFPKAADCAFADENLDVRRNYAAMIENIDRNIGLLFDCLSSRPDCGDTLVVYASDHGEMMGEHGLFAKTTMYEGALRIPLLIHLPGMDKAAICDAPAMLMDLAPTILELTGTSYDATAMDACSLVPLLKGEDVSLRVAQISELRNMMMVFDGRYKWIRNWNDSDELYDLEQDPDEMHNIIKDHPDIIKRLTTYTFTH